MALSNPVNAGTTGFQSLNATTGVWNGRTLTAGTGISITNGTGTGGDPVITATGAPAVDVSFYAYMNASQAAVTGSGVAGKVIFDTASGIGFNTGAGYNTGTGVFTAPSSGKYWFFSSVQNFGVFAAGQTSGNLSFNYNAGTTIFRGSETNPSLTASAGTNALSMYASAYINMTAGDTLYVAYTIIGGGAGSIGVFGTVVGVIRSFFQGVKLV